MLIYAFYLWRSDWLKTRRPDIAQWEEHLTLTWFRVLRFKSLSGVSTTVIIASFLLHLWANGPLTLSHIHCIRKMIKYSSISNLAKTETELYNFCNIFLIIIKYMYMYNIKFMKSIFVLWLLSRPMFLIVVLEDLQVIVGRSWQKEARNRPINCQDFFFVTTHVVQRCFRTRKRLCWQWLLVDAINELQFVDRPVHIF